MESTWGTAREAVGHAGTQTPVVCTHSANKGVKQVEWGQAACVRSGFSPAVCIQNEGLNFVFF